MNNLFTNMHRKLERLNFKELAHGKEVHNSVGSKIFVPSRIKAEEPPPPPPPPTFNEEQMMAAEREGYKKGFLAGEKEGRAQESSAQAEVNKELTGMLESFVNSIGPIFEQYKTMVMSVQKDLPAVAMAIAKKAAGDALDANAEQVVTDMAMRACETMITEPELTIIANEAMADTLEHKLQELAQRLPAATRIVIVRDPAMPRPDCRIEWSNGTMERITASLWKEIDRALGNMEVINTRETFAKMDELQKQIVNANDPQSGEKE